MNEWLAGAGITTLIGIIGYFLKRTMNRVDRHDEDIDKIKVATVRTETYNDNLAELKTDIKQIREDYTPKTVHVKDYDECRKDIKQIKEDYIMKEDFYREINKVDKKLDYITDLMIKTMANREG